VADSSKICLQSFSDTAEEKEKKKENLDCRRVSQNKTTAERV
jgi:hypothetical protein